MAATLRGTYPQSSCMRPSNTQLLNVKPLWLWQGSRGRLEAPSQSPGHQLQADLPDDHLATGVECPNYMDYSGGQRALLQRLSVELSSSSTSATKSGSGSGKTSGRRK